MRNISPIDSAEALRSVPKACSLHCCPAFTVELFILVSRASQWTHWGALCTEGAVHNGSGKERIWDTSAGELGGRGARVRAPFLLLNWRIHGDFSGDGLHLPQSTVKCFQCSFGNPLEMIILIWLWNQDLCLTKQTAFAESLLCFSDTQCTVLAVWGTQQVSDKTLSSLRHWLSSDRYPSGSLVDALKFCCSNTSTGPTGLLRITLHCNQGPG